MEEARSPEQRRRSKRKVNKPVPKEDSDEDLFIPGQWEEGDDGIVSERAEQVALIQQDRQQLTHELPRLKERLAKEKARARKYQEDIDLFESGNKKNVFYIEQMRARRMSPLWIIMVIASLFCTFGSFAQQAYLMTAVNLIAFLMVWRKLYVDTNNVPMFIALGAIAFTIKFV